MFGIESSTQKQRTIQIDKLKTFIELIGWCCFISIVFTYKGVAEVLH